MKPFARIEQASMYNHERLDLFVAERFVASEPVGRVLDEDEALPKLAERINAAVEAREARLRGALLQASEALCRPDFDGVGLCIGCEVRFDRLTDPVLRQHHLNECFQARALDAIADLFHHGTGPDYVSGDVACGLAWDLGHEQAKVRELSAMVDAVTGPEAEIIAPFLRAMGLREAPWEPLWNFSDEELAGELRRRGIGEIDRRVCREIACNRIAVANGRCGLHATEFDVSAAPPAR